MTRADLRHRAWNYGQLAAAAEMNAVHALTERECDAWNNVTIHLMNCVEEIERLLTADEPRLPFVEWVGTAGVWRVSELPMRVTGGMR